MHQPFSWITLRGLITQTIKKGKGKGKIALFECENNKMTSELTQTSFHIYKSAKPLIKDNYNYRKESIFNVSSCATSISP